MAQISLARGAAHAMLLAVEAGMGHADDLLRNDPMMAKMPDADRRLTTTLVVGVLRWQIQLDQEIRRFLAKPKAKLDPAVLMALRMGAFQLLHLDRIPAHAAIDESVELAKRSGYRSAAGLVNAVLRKLADAAKKEDCKAESEGAPGMQAGSDVKPATAPAVAAHPEWIFARWKQFFGEDAACAICVHDQCPPAPAIRFASPAVEQELSAAGITLSPGKLLSAARMIVSGDVSATSAFRENRVRLQDEGSQLVAEIAAWQRDPQPGTILDCCAAPGGKTLILGERHPAARIVACEASRPRWKLLRERLAGLGDRIDCRIADATSLGFSAEFDMVLADVPCSGTGTLGRNPEIRHRLEPGDLLLQAERQRAILLSALRAVRPGGSVVYSTCSLEPEENEQVVGEVLAEQPDAVVIALGPVLEALHARSILTPGGAASLEKCLTSEGFLRLLPGVMDTDGFFIAMLGRGGKA